MASNVLFEYPGEKGRWLEVAEPSIYGDDIELRITRPDRSRIMGRITLSRDAAVNLAREILEQFGSEEGEPTSGGGTHG